jgi:hypothetical protein
VTVNDLGSAATQTVKRIAEGAQAQNPDNPIKVIHRAELIIRIGLILSAAGLIALSSMLGIAVTLVTGIFMLLIVWFAGYAVTQAVDQVTEYLKNTN